MPAKKYYNLSRSILAVVCLLLGAYGGWYVFAKVLGKEVTEESFRHTVAEEKAKKDTVYVKVVNPSFNGPSTTFTRAARQDTARTTDRSGETLKRRQRPANEEELPPQSGAYLEKRQQPNISSIVANAADTASGMRNKETFKAVFSSWPIWAASAVAVLILLVAFFMKDDSLANATLKDVPPAILEQLFAELHDEINLFRNPRKILRYRNAVSYHYFFFKQKNLDTPDNVRKMMNLLLAIHRSPAIVDTRDVDDAALSEPGWFVERFAQSPHKGLTQINLPEDREVVMLVLKLNADMG